MEDGGLGTFNFRIDITCIHGINIQWGNASKECSRRDVLVMADIEWNVECIQDG